MSSGIYFFEGTSGRDGKRISLGSRFDDPVKGTGTWHLTTRIADGNTEVTEMHMTYESGEEEKCEAPTPENTDVPNLPSQKAPIPFR